MARCSFPKLIVPGLALLLLSASLPALGLEGQWQAHEEVQSRLITPYLVAPTEGPITLGLHFRLAPGWHIYWRHSGDAGLPPELDLAMDEGKALTDAVLRFPAPERFQVPGGLVAFGYGHEVVYPVEVTYGPIAEDKLRLALSVDYLVCESHCIPYRDAFQLDQPLGEAETDPETAKLLQSWVERLPIAAEDLAGEDVDARSRIRQEDDGGAALELAIDGPIRATGKTDLFVEGGPGLMSEAPVVESTNLGVLLRASLSRVPTKDETLQWTATFLRSQGGIKHLEGRTRIDDETPEAQTRPNPGQAKPGIAGRGIFGLLTGALAAGVLLSLTPAVLSHSLFRPWHLLPIFLGACLALGAAAGAGWLLTPVLPLRDAGLAAVCWIWALVLWDLLPFGSSGPQVETISTVSGARRSGGRLGKFLPGLAHGVLRAALALPWVPMFLAPFSPELPVSLLVLLAATGLLLPDLLKTLPVFPEGAPEGRQDMDRLLGFLPVTAVLWLFYQLSSTLPPERLAALQVLFLAGAAVAWAARGRGPSLMRSLFFSALLILFAMILGAPPGSIEVFTP